MTFQEAEDHGLTLPHLDSVYKSAVHVDTSLAVFKTAQEQDSLQSAYIQLLQEFGNFLAENEFVWEKRTPCYNRIYFSADGGIDYFLFNFLGKPEYQPSPAQQAEFKRLLNEFIQDYQFGVTASIKFAQFSPTTYMP
ncbi:MAG: hypothetical protein MK078_05410 [Crocinitomicaceae bacterium]|nr:hypothetical protein [Crocinitomicaceae bacterium]